MSPDALLPLLLTRIYHEDLLFAQRTYVLLMVHTFMGTTLAVLVSSESPYGLLKYLVLLVGLFLALIQLVLGRRTMIAIRVWRKYLWLVEQKLSLTFDRAPYNYLDAGIVPIDVGVTSCGCQLKGLRLARHRAFIRLPMNRLFGEVVPVVLVLFWTAALTVTAHVDTRNWYLAGASAGLGLALLVLYFWLRPRSPEREVTPAQRSGESGCG